MASEGAPSGVEDQHLAILPAQLLVSHKHLGAMRRAEAQVRRQPGETRRKQVKTGENR